MTSALIGYTGFVGGNLARQMRFNEWYNSKNIEEIRGKEFDLLVCAGTPGAKWIANEKPDEDRDAIVRLLSCIKEVRAVEFVLLSTIDAIRPSDAYGRHRADFEAVIRTYVDHRKVVRLPALFGEGLRKNALYDLMTGQRLDRIAPNAIYQWYPLRRLWSDLSVVRQLPSRHAYHLFSEPIAMEEIRARFFPRTEIGVCQSAAPTYFEGGDKEFWLPRDLIFAEMRAFLSGVA